MHALDLLLQRNSATRLTEPAPGPDVLANMFQAALRAPDHARLQVSRFVVIEGAARHRLGDLMAEVAGAEADKADLLRSKALRAPMIIVVAVKLCDHPKVPEMEQYLSAGCAAHGLLLAAQAQGFAGIWRTGSFTYSPVTWRGLGLAEDERIVGFIYLGTSEGPAKHLPNLRWQDFVRVL